MVRLHCRAWLLLQSTKKQLGGISSFGVGPVTLWEAQQLAVGVSHRQQDKKTPGAASSAAEAGEQLQVLSFTPGASCSSAEAIRLVLCRIRQCRSYRYGLETEGGATCKRARFAVNSQACPSGSRCGQAQACKVLCCCICPFLARAGTGRAPDQQRSWLAGPDARDVIFITSMRS